jgi:site-specific DNA recombinase
VPLTSWCDRWTSVAAPPRWASDDAGVWPTSQLRVGGGGKKRPGRDHVREMIRCGEADMLVVWKLDRCSRSVHDSRCCSRSCERMMRVRVVHVGDRRCPECAPIVPGRRHRRTRASGGRPRLVCVPALKRPALSALVYARVSQDRRHGRSVSEQEAECRAWAAREGWHVVDVIVDNDRSASQYARRKRDGWERVKATVAAGGLDVLVTWEASRAQRDLDAYLELRRLCATSRVRWAYSGTMFDLSQGADRFRTGLDALVAEDEVEKIRSRVMRALRANAMSGRPHGVVGFGFRREYDPVTRELVGQFHEETQATLVREAASRVLAGESLSAVAKDWQARGVPTQCASKAKYGWRPDGIKRILINPAIVGMRVHRGEVVGKAMWSPILDDDSYDRLLTLFSDPSRQPIRHPDSAPRLLSGVCRCGVCDGPLRSRRSGGKSRKVRDFYQCAYSSHVSRKATSLEAYVQEVVIGWILAGSTSIRTTDPAIDQRTARISQLQRQLKHAIALHDAGTLSTSTFARIEAFKLAQLAQAGRVSGSVGAPDLEFDLSESTNPEQAWFRLTTKERRALLRSRVVVVVHPVKSLGCLPFERESVNVYRKP